MLKKKLRAEGKGQELKILNFVSKTAKALLIVVLFVAVFLICPLVLAQNDMYDMQEFAAETALPTASLGVIVARIINAALGLLGLIAVMILVYGGYLYMTARGEVEKVQKAKKLLVEAAIGLLIIILSFAIAQFIFWVLGINPWGGFGPGIPGGGGGGGGGGALGAGIIRSHYPARNQGDVPRNTKIAITFKEPICVSNDANSFVDTKNTEDLNDDVTKDNMILIYPRPAKGVTTKNNINPEMIKVYYKTDDKKTFTFRPVESLGNDLTPTWYVVELTNNLKKADCSTPAFGGFGGYTWKFEVSTELDIKPPQIKSVVPKALANPLVVARNTVIQINFDEAIDPTTIAGKLEIDGGGKTGTLSANSYDLMTVKAAADFVAGEFFFSNQYRTVEFITNDPCGVNSCGNQIYCLPGAKGPNYMDITVLIKAATLSPTLPPPTAEEKPELLGTKGVLYDGIVDMCSNSLDGNKDGTAQGPANTYDMNDNDDASSDNGDNATWLFKANDLIDLVPPQIETRNPEVSEPEFYPGDNLNLSFDKILLSSSLVQNESLILDQSRIPMSTWSGYWFEKDELDEKTTVTILTSGLNKQTTYDLIANEKILDNTQNCYLPCSDLNHCVRSEPPITPGQYIQGATWSAKGTYPTCDLTE